MKYIASEVLPEDSAVLVDYIVEAHKEQGKTNILQISLTTEYEILNNKGIKLTDSTGKIVAFSVYENEYQEGNGYLLYFYVNKDYRVGIATVELCYHVGKAMYDCKIVLTRPITSSQYMPDKYYNRSTNKIDMKGLFNTANTVLNKGA